MSLVKGKQYLKEINTSKSHASLLLVYAKSAILLGFLAGH
jgi:hypothetical protein